MVRAARKRVTIGEHQRPAALWRLGDQRLDLAARAAPESEMVKAGPEPFMTVGAGCGGLLDDDVGTVGSIGTAQAPATAERPTLVWLVAQFHKQPAPAENGPLQIRDP